MHTGGAPSKTLKVGFEAMLAPVPDIGNNEDRFVVAGMEFGDGNYVWVSHYKVKTELAARIYDSKIEFDSGLPATIKKGDSINMQVSAYITHPGAPIKLEAFMPNGYDVSAVDLLSF